MGFWEFAQQFEVPGVEKPAEVQALIDHNLAAKTMTGAEAISAERARQQEVEGYDVAHDDYVNGDLLKAAAAYIFIGADRSNSKSQAEALWPWPLRYFRPNDTPLRALEKAGALIAAEWDRLKAKENDIPKQ